MGADESGDDRQAQAVATRGLAARPGRVGAVETLEDTLGIRCRQPGTVVTDLEDELPVRSCRDADHDHRLRRRVLNGIADQVPHHLAQPQRVTHDHCRIEVGVDA